MVSEEEENGKAKEKRKAVPISMQSSKELIRKPSSVISGKK